jgi:hypothetical protein
MRLFIDKKDVENATNLGAGSGLFVDRLSNTLRFKSVVPGASIVIDGTDDEITISSAASGAGEANTVSNIGAGEGIFASKVGVDLRLKSLVAGNNVTLTSDADEIFINASGGGAASGQSNTASNIGSGIGIFKQKTGVDLEFKTLLGVSGVVISDGTDEVSIGTPDLPQLRLDFVNASGLWIKTASNVGFGVGTFDNQASADLRFRSLLAGSGIQVSLSGQTIRVDNALLDDHNILRSDFDNSSGVFRSDINVNSTNITNLQTDFTNSSGIFQNGVDIADTVRIDFDNSSGVFRSDIDSNTSNLTSLQTDFANSSGVFQAGVDTANQVSIDFANSSGIFVKNAENLGSAAEIFIQKDSDQNLEFRTFLGSSGIEISTSGNVIRFDNEILDDFNILNTDFVNASGNWIKTASNIGIGLGEVFSGKVGVDLQFRKLLSGSGIQIETSGNTVRIDSQLEDDVSINETNISNLSTDFVNSSGIFRGDIDSNTTNISSLQTDFVNSSGVFKNDIDQNTTNISDLQTDFTNSSGIFQAGVDTANEVRVDFDNASGIWVKDGENLGTGSGIFTQKDVNNNLEFKTLLAGGGIQITGDTDELTITSVASGAGEANTASNVGDGLGIFDTKSGVDLRFKSLWPGSGIQITASGSSLVFDSTAVGGGEANTGDNVGIGTGEIFAQKNGVTLELRRLLQGSGLQIATSGNTIRIDSALEDDVSINTSNITDLQIDFTNSSGVFRSDIDTNVTNLSSLQTDFNNSSGIFRNDIDTNSTNLSNLQTDFTNSSGVFRNDIDTNSSNVTSLQTDFTNSSGIFQDGANTADSVRTDFDNASGVWIKNASNVGLGTGEVFAQKSVANLEFRRLLQGSGLQIATSGNTIRIDSKLEDDVSLNVTNISNLQTDFTNSSGVFQNSIDTNTTDIANLQTDFTNASGNWTSDISTAQSTADVVTTNFINSSGVFRSDIDTNTTNIANLQTDFNNSSGVFRADIDTNTNDITDLRSDFDNSSGVFYKKDEDLIPLQDETFNIGSPGVKFDETFASSGFYAGNLTIGSTSGAEIVGRVNVIGTDVNTGFSAFRYVNSAAGPYNKFYKARGTRDNPLQVNDKDYVGGCRWLARASAGGNPDNWIRTADIWGGTYTGVGSGNIPGSLTFATNRGNQSDPETHVVLDPSGNLSIGDFGLFHAARLPFAQDRLEVSGVISSIAGGIRFPDGTLQVTSHDILRIDFDNSSGVFRSDIDANTTNITNLQTDFDNASGIWVKDGENLGAGSGVFVQKDTDSNLEFKTLVAGGNITFVGDADTLTISTGSGVGEANSGANVGIGTGSIFAQKNGTDLEFRKLLQGSGIQIATSGNTIRIDSSALSEVYRKNDDLIPTIDQSFDIGSEANTFKTVYAQSGIFASGVKVEGAVATPVGQLGTVSGMIVNLNTSNLFRITLQNPMTNFSFVDGQDGGKYTIILHQDASGSRLASWPSNFKWRGASAPTLTTTASGIDIVSFLRDGGDDMYYGDASLNFT